MRYRSIGKENRTGIVKEYNPEGKQINGFRMVNGKQKGGSVIFDENGKLKSFACEDKPLFNGDQERCGFNGKPAKVTLSNGSIVTHMDGRIIEKEYIVADGSKNVDKYSYSNTGEATVRFMEYHKNGKLYRDFSVINEKREGKFVEYADNGKLKMEKEYKNGVDMTEKIYYMNGKLKEDSIRNPDGKSMSVKSYWDNGQLQSAGVFAFKGRGYGSTIPVGKRTSTRRMAHCARKPITTKRASWMEPASSLMKKANGRNLFTGKGNFSPKRSSSPMASLN